MHVEQTRNDRIVACVLTISDTRTKDDDKSGRRIQEMLIEQGHEIYESRICPDDVEAIQTVLNEWLREETVDLLITTGGTGISQRDQTIETVKPYFTKELEGFGELFRFLSYTEDVGTKALLSRATAGTIDRKILFALPGSTKAVELAMKKLIIPELPHFVSELNK